MNYILVAVFILVLAVSAYFFLQTKEIKVIKPGSEITRPQAVAIFQEYLKSRQNKQSRYELSEVKEQPDGWSFTYTLVNLETGEKYYMPPGEYPFIVKKARSTEQEDGRPVR